MNSAEFHVPRMYAQFSAGMYILRGHVELAIFDGIVEIPLIRETEAGSSHLRAMSERAEDALFLSLSLSLSVSICSAAVQRSYQALRHASSVKGTETDTPCPWNHECT